jgi:hypothetical protein
MILNCTILILKGYGTLAGSWFYTLRAVRFLILRKGGKEVSFVCYTPFGENRITTVPLNHVHKQFLIHEICVIIYRLYLFCR